MPAIPKYSALIRDSIMDINAVVATYNAQIYQYVGDEIVTAWTVEKGKLPIYCIQFFFACDAKFKSRSLLSETVWTITEIQSRASYGEINGSPGNRFASQARNMYPYL